MCIQNEVDMLEQCNIQFFFHDTTPRKGSEIKTMFHPQALTLKYLVLYLAARLIYKQLSDGSRIHRPSWRVNFVGIFGVHDLQLLRFGFDGQ